MSEYYIPDITGTNPAYLQVNIPAYIYQVGMKLSFENSPVFVSSISISLTDGTGRSLVKDVDWEVKDDDIDQQAMQRAYLQDRNFQGVLVKSVTIKSGLGLNKQVALAYQEFYLTTPNRFFDTGTPVEFTPDLLKTLITGLGDLRQQVAKPTSPVAPNDIAPKLLAFDIDGTNVNNLIKGESVSVNTIVGSKVIRLSQGTFFKDSLKLVFNGSELDPTRDYTPIMVSPLTDKSKNPSGIYQYILINSAIAGVVTIDYHAVGGEIQVADVNALYEQLIAIKQFLSDSIFVTADTIVNTPVFRAVGARLDILEDTVMRRLLSGTPTYGDSNNNDATTRPIKSLDANLHWYTIATLYRVAGSTDIVQADQFKGRVYLPDSNIAFAFTVDFNLAQARNPVSFKTDSLVFDPKYTLFGDLDVAAPQYPLLRVVWNQSPAGFSGASLQIGVTLPELTDQMVVENFSSAESCWIMLRKNEFVTGQTTTATSSPEDTGFMLPDNASIWSDASAISHAATYVPRYENGYLVYSGAQNNLNSLVTVASTGSLFNVVLPTYFPIKSIKTLVVTMMDVGGTKTYDIEIPISGITDNSRYGKTIFADSQLETMAMSAEIDVDSFNAITVSLNVTEVANPLITNTPSAKTDVVRYIRARV